MDDVPVIVYDYRCTNCQVVTERTVAYAERDFQTCDKCAQALIRQMPAPMGRIAGRVVKGGGPDRFTADVMGIPLKDLPEGLKAKPSP